LSIAVLHGKFSKPNEDGQLDIDGRNSPPPMASDSNNVIASSREFNGAFKAGTFFCKLSIFNYTGNYDAGLNEMMPVMPAKEKPSLRVVGDVGGKIAIIIDDMIDDVCIVMLFLA
jgi:phosphoribosylpyrophosphate synthetase